MRSILVRKGDLTSLIQRPSHCRQGGGMTQPCPHNPRPMPPALLLHSAASAPHRLPFSPHASALTFTQAPTTHILLQQRKQEPPLLHLLPLSLYCNSGCSRRGSFYHKPCKDYAASRGKTNNDHPGRRRQHAAMAAV